MIVTGSLWGKSTSLVLAFVSTMLGASAAKAQNTDFMLDECARVAQTYFRDFGARADMKYNGQRVDGTHAINGRIFLETRFEDVACSYERHGETMIEFFAEGRVQNAYLPSDTPSAEGSVVQVTGLRGGDTLNVRSGAGTDNSIVGALSNGTSVRNLGCRMQGTTRWCQIEMMTDMRERGWVAGLYLTLSGATPSPAPGPIVRVTGVSANDVLNVRAGPGTNHRIVGALGNSTQVRRLECQSMGQGRWCQIEMMTDMRERGWVNARYLTGHSGAATQLPSLSRVERIRFQSGASGAEIFDQLPAGASVTYLLGARNGQTLTVELPGTGAGITYRIFNPDNSALLDQVASTQRYRGQLWQSGEHKIEIMNKGSVPHSFNLVVSIR